MRFIVKLLAGLFSLSASLIAAPAIAVVTVTMTNPSEGATTLFAPPASIPVEASASVSDPGYSISRVEFYAGTTLIGTATAAPYTFTWDVSTSGAYTLTAKAIATKGNNTLTGTSGSAGVIVDVMPTATLTSPADGSTFTAPATITLTAQASDSDGSVAYVRFWYQDYQLGQLIDVARVATPPYTATVSNLPPGRYLFNATAYDDLGVNSPKLGSQAQVTVNAPPTVALTSPTGGSVFRAPANITLTADAQDPDGNVQRVDFYQGTTLLGSSTTAPYTVQWADVPSGAYSLTAVATDNSGAVVASTPVSITVTAAVAQLYFIEVDHLDTPRLVADASGTTVWKWDQQEPFGDSVADENPSGLGTFDLPLRLPGQRYDKETGLAQNWNRDYWPGGGRYIESDLIGLGGGLNTYSYALNRPTGLVDWSGLACAATAGSVTCTVPGGGPTVTFPRPQGWPDVMNDDSAFHHFYNVPVDMEGADLACVMRELANRPTPGNPSPATPGGTLNNALPNTVQSIYNAIDRISSFGNDPGGYNNAPVMSYTVGNSVVNVTLPGHPLFPGYVVRQANGNVVNNYGEGTAGVQSRYSPAAPSIRNVWDEVTRQAIDKCRCRGK